MTQLCECQVQWYPSSGGKEICGYLVEFIVDTICPHEHVEPDVPMCVAHRFFRALDCSECSRRGVIPVPVVRVFNVRLHRAARGEVVPGDSSADLCVAESESTQV